MKKVISLALTIIICIGVTGCRKATDGSASWSELEVTEGTTPTLAPKPQSDETLTPTPTPELSPEELGYGLPVDEEEVQTAIVEVAGMLASVEHFFLPYIKSDNLVIRIPDVIMEKMTDSIAEDDYIVKSEGIYSNIKNRGQFEDFLNNSENGIEGSAILYELKSSGAFSRYRYTFDGSDMYVLESLISFDTLGDVFESYSSYTRIKSWRKTDTGWFFYELCGPEYPDESVDGGVLLRLSPVSSDCKKAGEKYIGGLGYLGNNFLRTDWDESGLDKIDYAGLYEYLYALDKGRRFSLPEDKTGIAADEFEGLITKYIPVSAENLRQYAAYDEQSGEYPWKSLGDTGYTPTYFDTSYPLVTDVKKNLNGTITLVISSVCENVAHDEAFITSELTIEEDEDGDFKYLGNKVTSGADKLPEYSNRSGKREY